MNFIFIICSFAIVSQASKCKIKINEGRNNNIEVDGFLFINCAFSTCQNASKIIFEKEHFNLGSQWRPVFEGINNTLHHPISTTKFNYSLEHRNQYGAFPTKHTLLVKPLKVQDHGNWRCVVLDYYGNYTSGKLKVNICVTPEEDSVYITPRAPTIIVNQHTDFKCTVDGIHPEPDVVWTVNGKEQTKGTPANTKRVDGLWSIVNTIRLDFKVSGEHVLGCIIQNKTRQPVLNNQIKIEVKKQARVLQPQKQMYFNINSNSKFTLNCTVTGYKQKISWKRNGVDILDDDNGFLLMETCSNSMCSGSIASTVIDQDVGCFDMFDYSGVYTCMVSQEPPYRSQHSSPNMNVHVPRRLCISSFGVKLGMSFSIGAFLISVVLVWLIHRRRKRKNGAESTQLLAPENTETNANLHNNSQESLTKRILENMWNLKHGGFPISNDIMSDLEKLLQGDLPQSDFRTNRIRSDIEYLNDSGCSIPNDIQLSFERLTQGDLSESEFRSNRIRSDIKHLNDSGCSIPNDIQLSFERLTQGDLSESEFRSNRIRSDIEYLNDSGCSIPNIQLSFERLTQGDLSESEFRSNRIRSDIEHLKDSGFSISSEVQSSLKLSTQGNMSSNDVLTNRITRDIEQLKSSENPNTEEFLSSIGFTQPLLDSKGESRVPNEVDRTDSDNTTDSEDPTQDANEHKLSEIQNDDTTNAVPEENPLDKNNEEKPIKQNNAEQDDTVIKTEDTIDKLLQSTQALPKQFKELKDKKTKEKASEMMLKLSFGEKFRILNGFGKNSDVIKVGDFVRVHTDRKTFEQLQEGYGGYEPEMASLVDETGQVTKKILHVFKVVFACGKEYLINGENLTRINSSVCTNGVLLQDEWVRISKDEETVRKSHSKAKTGWSDGMKKCLGYTGIVLGVRANRSVSVLCIDGKTWIFNADVLAKLNIKDVILETGDLVMVTQDKDALERLQKQRGLWQSDMGKQSGKLGTITGIKEQDKCLLVDMGRRKVKFNKLAIRLVAKGAEYMHARDDGEF